MVPESVGAASSSVQHCLRTGWPPTAGAGLASADRASGGGMTAPCQGSVRGAPYTIHASATQLAVTVTQKMMRNGCLVVLCRKTRRATSAPGQPPTRAIVWRVDSDVRHLHCSAADLSARYIKNATPLNRP